jgi:hypothetical protein
MSKHTPGPWRAFIWDASKPHRIAIGAVNAPGGADHVVNTEFKSGMADASRIVECVNAMEGIDDPAEVRRVLEDPRPLQVMAHMEELLAGFVISMDGVAIIPGTRLEKTFYAARQLLDDLAKARP